MFYTLYLVVFWLAWLALGSWFSVRDRSAALGLQRLTWLSLAALPVLLLLSDVSLSAKFFIAFRDLMLLALTGFVFQGFSRSKGRIALAFGLSAGLLFAGQSLFKHPPKIAGAVSAEQVAESEMEIPLDEQGEWLLELANGQSLESLQAWADHHQVSIRRAFFPGDGAATELDDYYVLDIPNGQEERLAAALDASGVADWWEPNEAITVAPLPSPRRGGTEINRRFGIDDPHAGEQWALEALEMDKLYGLLNKTKARKRAVIAILDTGIDADHEDIADNYVSTRKRYDDDPKGHGTHCAGIAVAVTNNGKGVASFARKGDFVQVTSVKVLSAAGMGTQQSIINGMLEAADQGVDVISMSLGGFSNQAKQRAYAQAVEYANKKGAIVVAAAGNFNRNAANFSPVNAPGVIGVSAVDQAVLRAPFSNTVADISMGVAAPGVGIFSTIPNNQYKAYNGTSMAAPFVAGLVGVLRSLRPDLQTEEVYQLLTRTGKDTDNTTATGKFIQPYRAVEALLAGAN